LSVVIGFGKKEEDLGVSIGAGRGKRERISAGFLGNSFRRGGKGKKRRFLWSLRPSLAELNGTGKIRARFSRRGCSDRVKRNHTKGEEGDWERRSYVFLVRSCAGRAWKNKPRRAKKGRQSVTGVRLL